MNLYLVSQEENLDYDTYDSMVVAAETEEQARLTDPSESDNEGLSYFQPDENGFLREADQRWFGPWATNIKNVKVELIGEAVEGTPMGIVCSSFHAG